MAVLSVLIAAIVGFAIGAGWYMALSRPWIRATGLSVDENGRPVGKPVPYLFFWTFLCILIVAAMLRHVLDASAITAPMAGAVAGLGVGLFFIAPWITMNVLYTMRPVRLAAIDGGYAAVACAAMGLVLTLF